MKAREIKRAKLVARYAEKREALKKIIATSNDPAEAYEAARKLQAIPKNANPIRLHNRCKITSSFEDWLQGSKASRPVPEACRCTEGTRGGLRKEADGAPASPGGRRPRHRLGGRQSAPAQGRSLWRVCT